MIFQKHMKTEKECMYVRTTSIKKLKHKEKRGMKSVSLTYARFKTEIRHAHKQLDK